MNFTNLFRIAFKAIANNKMRSFLTALGIIIGIASVIAMLSLGQATKEQVKGQISEMGTNIITIMPGGETRGGVRQEASAMQTLKIADYEALRSEATFLSAISPVSSASGQLIAGGNNYPASVSGVSMDYLTIRQLEIEEGEMFTEDDERVSAKVIVIGKTIADNLFPNQDPIGKTVRLNQVPFRVVGLLKAKGYNSMGMDQDEIVLAPYTTVMKRLQSQTYLGSIMASALSEELTTNAENETTQILRRTHKLKSTDDDDFTIRSMQEMMEMMDTVTGMLTALLAGIAGISLLVGGIGIMNIMYVSVTERTREIGLRMSVGARGADILAQFLIEALVQCLAGGVIGIIVGCLGAVIGLTIMDMPVVIETSSIGLAFAVCTIIGLFFGWYPAKKAANLDPIDAIRYE